MKKHFILISFLPLIVLTQSMTAQEALTPTISTERPSVGSGPDLVPPFWILVENGLGIKSSSASFQVDGSETMIRYGLSKRLEIRFAPPSLVQSSSSTGFFQQDGSVTVKTPLPTVSEWHTAFSGGYTIPLASKGQGSGSWDPTLLLTTSHSWARRWTTGATWNTYWTSVPGSGRTRSHQAAFDIGWNASSTKSTFAEYAPLFNSDMSQAGYTADVGVAWIRNSLQQWDARVGYTRTGPDGAVVAGLGYSFMLPQRMFLLR